MRYPHVVATASAQAGGAEGGAGGEEGLAAGWGLVAFYFCINSNKHDNEMTTEMSDYIPHTHRQMSRHTLTHIHTHRGYANNNAILFYFQEPRWGTALALAAG